MLESEGQEGERTIEKTQGKVGRDERFREERDEGPHSLFKNASPRPPSAHRFLSLYIGNARVRVRARARAREGRIGLKRREEG